MLIFSHYGPTILNIMILINWFTERSQPELYLIIFHLSNFFLFGSSFWIRHFWIFVFWYHIRNQRGKNHVIILHFRHIFYNLHPCAWWWKISSLHIIVSKHYFRTKHSSVIGHYENILFFVLHLVLMDSF